MISQGAIQECTVSPDELLGAGSIHSGALGVALSIGAIIGLAVWLVVETTTTPIAVALAYAAVSFLVLRYFLPWKDSFADARSQVQ